MQHSNHISNFRRSLISCCLILGITLIFTPAKAQIGRGCYVGGVLYTENTDAGNRFFYRSPGNLVSDCGYNRTGSTGNCRLYNGGDIYKNKSYTLYYDAFSNGWEEIICPIDDYVVWLLLTVAGFSVFKLKLIRNPII